MNSNQFERISEGATVMASTQEHTFYTTINHNEDGKICEMFVRLDDKDLFEMITLVTRLSSMAFRAGVNPMTVAKELQGVYSPVTQHMIPGTNKMCPSIIARIGIILEEHIRDLEDAKNGME